MWLNQNLDDTKVTKKTKNKGQHSLKRLIPDDGHRKTNVTMVSRGKKILPGRWRGIIHSRNKGEKVEFVDLDEELVNENFTKEMRQLVMDLRIEGRNGYISIPEGANELKDAVSEEKRLGFPQVKYCNDETNRDIRRCLLDSAASGLHYLGMLHLANCIRSTVTDQKKDNLGWDYLWYFLTQKSTKEERRQFRPAKLKMNHTKEERRQF